MSFRHILIISVVLSLLGGAFYGWRHTQFDLPPDLVFTTLKGERIVLHELRGSPVLVTFWASDCRACLEEMPGLTQIYQKYAWRGLKMIGVAMAYDIPSRVLALSRQRQLPYPIVLDLTGQLARAFAKVALVPQSFLIGPDGRVCTHQLGALDMRGLRSRIEKLLPEV
jgi:peroxiredoxin